MGVCGGIGDTCGYQVWVLQAPVDALDALIPMCLDHLEAGGCAGPAVPEDEGTVVPNAGKLVGGAGTEHQISNNLLVPLHTSWASCPYIPCHIHFRPPPLQRTAVIRVERGRPWWGG
jgi:hypothetical protein